MGTRSTLVAAAVAVALLSGLLRASEAQEGSSGQSWQPFINAVQKYAALHRDVEQSIGGPKISRDARTISAAVDTLAAGIRAARPSARAGDIMGGETAVLLRQCILDVLRERRIEPSALRAAAADDGGTLAPRPVVNERYSWSWPSFAPPSVLAALPMLPAELQYRFVGGDLVLVDVEANLVVDVLPDALPISIE
jgi:hypothetical protein